MATGGLLALGDSITVGEGSSMPGVPCRAWVSWLARDLGLALTNLAANGAQVRDLLDQQLRRAPEAFALACLYIGVNDVRDFDFDLDAFSADLETVARGLAQRGGRLLMVTVPLDLGRPRAGAKVLQANRVIRRVAGAHGATLVSNEGRRGWHQVQPDAVHLTALGQRALAADALRALASDDALRALATDRAVAAANTAPLRDAHLGAPRVLRYALTGYAPALWHDLRRRAREGTRW